MKRSHILLIVICTIVATIIGICILNTFFANVIEKYDDASNSSEFDEIVYEVPSSFEKDGMYTYSKYYSASDNNVYCHINVDSSNKYYTEYEDWFKHNVMVQLSDKVSEIKELNINGNKVLHVTVETDSSKYYYYGIESSNHYYMFKYSISDYMKGDIPDIDKNACYNSVDLLVSSINIK